MEKWKPQCEEIGNAVVTGKVSGIPGATAVVLMLAQRDVRQLTSALRSQAFSRVRCCREVVTTGCCHGMAVLAVVRLSAAKERGTTLEGCDALQRPY